MEDQRFQKITLTERPDDFDGWQFVSDRYGHTHLIPIQPRHLHALSTACWCEPFYEFTKPDSGVELWAHNPVH